MLYFTHLEGREIDPKRAAVLEAVFAVVTQASPVLATRPVKVEAPVRAKPAMKSLWRDPLKWAAGPASSW